MELRDDRYRSIDTTREWYTDGYDDYDGGDGDVSARFHSGHLI